MSATTWTLRDVTLRDGLQLTGGMLPTERKLQLARSLRQLGVQELEVGAMARPDLVPPMANTLEVLAGLTPAEHADSWVWVASPRSAARAVAAGARNLQYCLSVADDHNRANVGRDTEESVAAMPEVAELVDAVGGRIQLTLATAFTSPFSGPVDSDRVLQICTDPRTRTAESIVIADTLGQAVPDEVGALIGRVVDTTGKRIGFHGHDTWGLGVANGIAALAAGATFLDSALGGLGGCPFAPGASGNTATEDLLFALRPGWVDPNSFAQFAALSQQLLAELGEPQRSRATTAAGITPGDAFSWAATTHQNR